MTKSPEQATSLFQAVLKYPHWLSDSGPTSYFCLRDYFNSIKQPELAKSEFLRLNQAIKEKNVWNVVIFLERANALNLAGSNESAELLRRATELQRRAPGEFAGMLQRERSKAVGTLGKL
jgi:hypothetical protein